MSQNALTSGTVNTYLWQWAHTEKVGIKNAFNDKLQRKMTAKEIETECIKLKYKRNEISAMFSFMLFYISCFVPHKWIE